MNEVLKKISNNEYVSRYDLGDLSIDIGDSNSTFIETNKLKYKDYFNDMYKNIDSNIILDSEQLDVILSEEKYSLVLAGAGTGKTTTIVSKIKYLIDIKNIPPSKILVLSFTRKATNELVDRLIYDFNLPVDISTFHSLGFKIIRNLYYSNNPYVVDENVRKKIFIDYFKEKFVNKDFILNLINSFNDEDNWYFSTGFKINYDKFKTFTEYFNDYKMRKYNEIMSRNIDLSVEINNRINDMINSEYIYTIKGELVKSKGEALIANYLFINNIDYNYESVYKGILPDYKSYKPDFTILYGGSLIYLEYFGLSNYDSKTMNKYNKIKEIKEKYHKEHNNKFIKIDYMPNEDIINTLEYELDKLGIKRKKKSDKEIFYALLDLNEKSEFYPFYSLLYSVIDKIKESTNRNDFYKIIMNHINTCVGEEKNKKFSQLNIISDFYRYYQERLFNNTSYGFDYSDMIYYASNNLFSLNSNVLNYDYIFIDEYQDISSMRYELAYKLGKRNSSSLVAVGDDWQSIYGFSGSNIKYIYNFEKSFKYSKLFKISTTYRNSQNLVNYAGEFIMKNKMQIQKDLISFKDNIDRPIRFVKYDDIDIYEKIKNIIKVIHDKFKDDKIMILARYNKSIDNLLLNDIFIDGLDTKVLIKNMDDVDINAMTIHKAKGLTTDHVILIDFDYLFPQELPHKDYYIINLLNNNDLDEPILYPEERRIFYVALTRARKYTFILIPSDVKKQSVFYKEIEKIIDKY